MIELLTSGAMSNRIVGVKMKWSYKNIKEKVN